MKSILTLPALLLTMSPLAAADTQLLIQTTMIRPVFDNLTTSAASTLPTSFVHSGIQGLSGPTKASGGTGGRYNDGAVTLEESNVGQPFASFDPGGAYINDLVAEIRSKLYPAPTATRGEVDKSIADGGAAFRYLSLLYSKDSKGDVTTAFQNMDKWYGEPERAQIANQIVLLRAALSRAPLDARLRGLLLDAYTDRAVAEIQFVKQQLEKLGTLHLKLESQSDFIIDDEIILLKQISDTYLAVITQFSDLFSNTTDGVEPADFDTSVARGIPFGYYIFQKEQPNRNQVRSRFFENTDPGAVLTDVPSFNEQTGATTTANAPNGLTVKDWTASNVTLGWIDQSVNETGFLIEYRPLSGAAWPVGTGPSISTGANITTATVTGLTPNQPYMFRVSARLSATELSTPSASVTGTPAPASVVPRPINEVLANGYRDYVTLLTVMADFVNRSGELNRLRGLRQLPASGGARSDLDTARAQISDLLAKVPTNVGFLRAMFPEDGAAFRPGDTSGIFGARTGVETAIGGLVNTRSFLDGTANLLGLDPNFLVLIQNDSAATYNNGTATVSGFDSFAQIVSRLRGEHRPLTVALDKQTAAMEAYKTFRASVDEVTKELNDESDAYADRFREITGFEMDTDADPMVPLPYDDGKGNKAVWDGKTPNPHVASELKQIADERAQLVTTDAHLEILLGIFGESEKQAKESVRLAGGLDQARTDAETKFLNETDPLYTLQTISNVTAATLQSGTDAAFGVSGASLPAKIPLAIVSAANTVAQGVNAGINVEIPKKIEQSARAYESRIANADNALAVSQANENVLSLDREKSATAIQQTEILSSLAQLNGREASLRAEITRILRNFDSNNEAIRSTLHANPIHYFRSQTAIIDADAAFADAQRWMFYAQRALEHKWTQRFAVVSGGKNYDSGSVFKMRNAVELNDLLTAYFAFDAKRELNNAANLTTSIISFKKHLLAPKPNLLDINDPPENDKRDNGTGQAITQAALFRQKLASYRGADGTITIPFNTALLQNVEGLFKGPTYASDGKVLEPGQWRDKIAYVKVNIVATNGPIAGPGGQQPRIINGSLSYGGQTYFRTRVVPGGTPALYITRPTNATPEDIGGEFSINTYHYYDSTNLDDVFFTKDSRLAAGNFAYTGQTARTSSGDPAQEDILGTSFQINDFKELSVAATGWNLIINGRQPNQAINLDQITDIELIIRHQSFSRVLPNY